MENFTWNNDIVSLDDRLHPFSQDDFEKTRSSLEDIARKLHYRVFEIDSNFLITRASLMPYIAEVFSFPDWFGANWDAVFDLLTDMSWMDAEGYVVIFLNEEALNHLHGNELAKFAHVIGSASKFWSTNSPKDPEHPRRPFHIIGVSSKEHPLLGLIR